MDYAVWTVLPLEPLDLPGPSAGAFPGRLARPAVVMEAPDPKASYVLSNLPEVVERILGFLPTKSLLRAACVCQLWRECSRRILRTQQNITCVTATIPGEFISHVLLYVLKEDIEKVQVLPQTALYILTDPQIFSQKTEDTYYSLKKARRRCSKELAPDFEKLLPTGCQVLGLETPGVVVTYKGNDRPLEIEEADAGFAVLFPKIDGVKIQIFHFFKDPKRQTLDEEQFAEAGLKNNPDLRAMLLFGYNNWKLGSSQIFRQIVNRLNEKSIILAGGYVEKVLSLTSHTQPAVSCGVVGLAFSGAQIQGASVLLDQDVKDEKLAEAAMQRLKAANIPEHHSLGFMFACVGRGLHFYKKSNVEANVFRKYFPNVPLFGFFGHGEIGCDRIVTGNFVLRECPETKDDLVHSYSTVMTLLHFGSANVTQV